MEDATIKKNKEQAREIFPISYLRKNRYTKALTHIKLGTLLSLFFVFFTTYIAFYNLGKAPLDNWDEAWYAEVTKQMLRTKEFVILNWNGGVWLDKPPMYMWLSALISSVIGLSEFSVRLTSALSGLIAIMLVVWHSKKEYGIVPAILAFSTLALNNIFVWRMRSGNIDIFVTFLILLTYFVLIGKNKYRYPLLGLLFSFIFLTKASLIMFPLSIFLVHEILFQRKNIFKQFKEYLKFVGALLLLPGLWLLIGYLKIGLAFPIYYLFTSDQGVASVSLAKFNTDYIMHTYYSLQRRFSFVFIAGIVFALRHIRDAKIFLLLLYATALLIQLSFTDRNNNWYLIPSMPFWSLLVAFATYHIINIFRKNKFIIGIIILLTLYISYRTFTINILPILDTSSSIKQTESSKLLNKIAKSDDVIVRLDHLYPATIYYTNRKVLASPKDTVETKKIWINRNDLITAIQKKNIRWIVGENSEVENFVKQAAEIQFRQIKVNDVETIAEAL